MSFEVKNLDSSTYIHTYKKDKIKFIGKVWRRDKRANVNYVSVTYFLYSIYSITLT